MKKQIAISEFKSHCLDIIKNLEKTKSSIIITKRNKPIATVSAVENENSNIFGILSASAEIKGDIINPIEDTWEVEK